MANNLERDLRPATPGYTEIIENFLSSSTIAVGKVNPYGVFQLLPNELVAQPAAEQTFIFCGRGVYLPFPFSPRKEVPQLVSLWAPQLVRRGTDAVFLQIYDDPDKRGKKIGMTKRVTESERVKVGGRMVDAVRRMDREEVVGWIVPEELRRVELVEHGRIEENGIFTSSGLKLDPGIADVYREFIKGSVQFTPWLMWLKRLLVGAEYTFQVDEALKGEYAKAIWFREQRRDGVVIVGDEIVPRKIVKY